jgi:transposase
VSQREQIIGMLCGGYTIAEVANAYGRTNQAICNLRKKYTQTGSVQDKSCSGRPPMLSTQQKKILYRKARSKPKIEYSELCKDGIFVDTEGTPTKAL